MISNIATYIPQKIVHNTDLAALNEHYSSTKIKDKLGIESRPIVEDSEFVSDIATKAGEKLIEQANLLREDIDMLIVCTQSPDYLIPTTACIVHKNLGLKVTCGAFDFNLGCSGFIYGLTIAEGLLKTNTADNILLITADTYSKHIEKSDIPNRAIFGDAAAAVLLNNDGKYIVGQFDLGTDGTYYNSLISYGSGMNKESSETPKLFMNGKDIFNFTIEKIPPLVKQNLKSNSITINNCDYFIFHQANKFILNHLRKKIGIPEEKFHIELMNLGNTVSSTIPIALSSVWDQNYNTIQLTGFGVGLSWGSVVITKRKC